jgi:hypothetical protein
MHIKVLAVSGLCTDCRAPTRMTRALEQQLEATTHRMSEGLMGHQYLPVEI